MQNHDSSPRFVQRAAAFLVRHRGLLFWGMLLAVLAGSVFLVNLHIDNSIESWFLDDDPALLQYEAFKGQYGNDEVIVALIPAGKDGIFVPDFLNRLHGLAESIEAHPHIRRVLSIGNAPWIGLRKDEDGDEALLVEDLIEGTVETVAQAAEIRTRFGENRLWPKLLVDRDEGYAVLIIEPEGTNEMDARRPELLAFVHGQLAGTGAITAGMGVMYEELNRLSMRDSSLFTSLSYLMLIVMAFLLYRSVPLTAILTAVMGISALALLDVCGATRTSFNMVTVVLPTLMIILSTADVSHVFNHYCVMLPKIRRDREAGLTAMFAAIFVPCFFTSATTCLGFASIYFSRISVLRTFGVFAALSAMLEFFVVMITTAYLLGKMDPNRERRMERPFARVGERLAVFATRRGTLLLGIFFLCIVLAAFGVRSLQVDTYSMGFLPESNAVRQDSDRVEAVYGYYLPLEVRLITSEAGAVQEPEFLRRLSRAQERLESLPDVQKTASVTDVVKRLNLLWTDGKPESYRICETRLQARQLLDFYAGDPDNDLEYMLDRDRREARLTVRIPMVSAQGMKTIRDRVDRELQTCFSGYPVQIVFGGYVPLYIQLLEYITWSQVTSFSVAILVIFLLVGLLFRRISSLLFGLVCNVTPIAFILGFMGFAGIRLDIATVTIAAITLGIAVDDTIHILFHYYRHRDEGLPARDSILGCIRVEGSPVIATSVILCAGFAVLGLASIKSVIFFGLLIALTMVFALLCDIILLPALITGFNSKSGNR